MIKYFLIPALLFTCQLPVISQKLNIDSLRIDSLKKQLFYLKDSARVNLLLAITEQSGYFPPKLMADSNLYYMNLAYKEAYNLGYKYGMAMSNIRIGNRELFRNKNVPEAKKYITAAVSLGESIHNPKILSRAYYSLAEVLMKENMEENFSKAEGYYKNQWSITE